MAFDGITTAAVVRELSASLTGGGISRIVQTEKDELQLLIKNNKKQYILFMSANASLPLIYLSDEKKEAPITAPNFCMLLRKHIQGGQITAVTQPGLERVVIFTITHRDELGDLREKKLILELMGKYSNIIFTDEENTIIDSIKRVPASMSSVREVLPGRKWFIPAQNKTNPLSIEDEADFLSTLSGGSSPDIVRALYGTFTGLSPAAAEEFVFEAGIDPRKTFPDLLPGEQSRLASAFLGHMERIRNGVFTPNIVLKNGEPVEFGVFPYRMYGDETAGSREKPSAGPAGYSFIYPESVSHMLLAYYGAKDRVTRMRQKSSDLRHLASTALERTNKKFASQQKQLASTAKKDKYRIYGEMLNAYGYEAEDGAKSLSCQNYYTGEPLIIPLDPTMTAQQNAQKYFARYGKLKRTEEALTGQIAETEADREQLESILTSIDLAESEADLHQIRRELSDYGFAQKKSAAKKGAKRESKAAPYEYLSSDGFTMYVGRNNYQNEELDFKIANGGDWWFHVKRATGSHVIVRTMGKEVPDRTFEEAGALASWYSSERKSPKVEVDYTQRKNLRKKNGGKPGFVIYHTNYSLMAVPDISKLKRVH